MTIYYAQKSGNLSANDVWFDAPAGGSGVTSAVANVSGNILAANTFTIDIDVAVNLGTGRISTAAEGGSAGGAFTIASAIALTSTYVLPTAAQVEYGVTFGPSSSLTGTYVYPDNNAIAQAVWEYTSRTLS